MADTLLLPTPNRTSEALDQTRLTRHQIRGHLQAIHIGLYLLEHHFDMSESDVQAELLDLKASLHKTAHVMDAVARLQQTRASWPSK